MECPKCHFENNPGTKLVGDKNNLDSTNYHSEAKKDTQEISMAANNFAQEFLETIKHPMKAQLLILF